MGIKNKALISILTLLVFVSQLTAMAMPCLMSFQNQSNSSNQSLPMDHSNHQMEMTSSTMSHEMPDDTLSKMTSSMACCDTESDCSMGGCFSMLASFDLLPVNNPVIGQKIFQSISAIINPVALSLYRPPISL